MDRQKCAHTYKVKTNKLFLHDCKETNPETDCRGTVTQTATVSTCGPNVIFVSLIGCLYFSVYDIELTLLKY